MTTTQRPEVGQSVEANGIRTNYLEAGSGEGTVVLIHGSGPGVTAYSNWRLVLPALGEDFHVLAPDMVGFGYSDRPDDVEYNVQTWADQTVGFMDAMGIKKAHLVGNSFGGAIALRIATQHPERADRLVLMGSMGVDFPITEGLDAVWGYEGTIESMRGVLDYFAYSRDLVNEELAQVRYKASVEPGFQESFSAMFPAPRQRWVTAMSTLEDEIRKLQHRTLVMHGREDKVIPVSNSYKLEELIDNADLAVFSHCGHWSMIERTADFNRLVRDFFLGVPTKPVITSSDE
jgi:pimeloyl-ACP methyl ester carboxylesterase